MHYLNKCKVYVDSLFPSSKPGFCAQHVNITLQSSSEAVLGGALESLPDVLGAEETCSPAM